MVIFGNSTKIDSSHRWCFGRHCGNIWVISTQSFSQNKSTPNLNCLLKLWWKILKCSAQHENTSGVSLQNMNGDHSAAAARCFQPGMLHGFTFIMWTQMTVKLLCHSKIYSQKSLHAVSVLIQTRKSLQTEKSFKPFILIVFPSLLL